MIAVETSKLRANTRNDLEKEVKSIIAKERGVKMCRGQWCNIQKNGLTRGENSVKALGEAIIS